jgi:hypothetical protein
MRASPKKLKLKQKRSRITNAAWRELQSAFFVGGELRALAREAGISENTVLHKAMREGWTEQRRQALAKLRQTRQETRGSGSSGEPNQSLAITREGLLERHLFNMLAVSGRVSDYAADLPAQTAFTAVRHIDVADRLARRQLGLDREDKISVNIVQAYAEVSVSAAGTVGEEPGETIVD